MSAPVGTLNLSGYGSGIDLSGSLINGGNGGTVSLTYNSLTTATGGAFSVSANAGFNSLGGTVNIENTSTNTLSIGSGLGDLTLSASGAGGSVNVKTGGLLNVDNDAGQILNAQSISLQSGTAGAFGINLFRGLTGTNLALRSGNGIFNASGNALTFTGNLSLVANQVDLNNSTYTAANISIGSLSAAGSDLSLTSGSSATLSAGTITIGAVDTLNFTGNFLYDGQTVLSGQSIVATGSTQTLLNSQLGFLVTPSLVGGNFNGTWTSTVSPLSGISLINNPGSVVLSGDIIFAGNFAIVATGDIDLTGANINLSGT